MRLQRVLAHPQSTATQIRAAAAEVEHVPLEDALGIVLALLDREPETFPRAGARWGARLILERRLALPTPSWLSPRSAHCPAVPVGQAPRR